MLILLSACGNNNDAGEDIGNTIADVEVKKAFLLYQNYIFSYNQSYLV